MPLLRPAPFFTAAERIETADTVLVKVQIDNGIFGLGYCWAPGDAKARVLDAMIHELGHPLLGQDPEDIRGLWQGMWNRLTYFGHSGVSIFALSAIDLAVWDLIGKVREQPLYKLLCAGKRAIRCYASGIFLTSSISEAEKEAASYVERGFNAIKMKVGHQDIRTDVERVCAVRRVLGTNVKLMVDAVQQWNVDQALTFAKRVSDLDILWLEDPLPYSSLGALKGLRTKTEIQIAVGEFCYSPWGIREILNHEAADTLIFSLPRIGGITGWMSAAALAAAANVPVSSHIFPELSVHVMAATPNAYHLEFMDWWSSLFEGIPTVKDGFIEPSEEPGLGIHIKAEARKKWNIQL